MTWYRRLLWPIPRRGRWPDRLPPTVPGSGPVVFHCPHCKQVPDQRATTCPHCGHPL